MPLTTLGKNAALDGIAGGTPATISHLGLLTAQTPITGVTGEDVDDVFDKTSHGLANGELVILTELTGGSGLVAGDADNANEAAKPYFVINANANDFQLARTPGGAAVEFGSDITDVTVIELLEISGGSPAYARQACSFNAGSGAQVALAANEQFDIPSGGVVDYQSGHTASTAGNVLAIDKVTQETYGAQGLYTSTGFTIRMLTGE